MIHSEHRSLFEEANQFVRIVGVHHGQATRAALVELGDRMFEGILRRKVGHVLVPTGLPRWLITIYAFPVLFPVKF